MNGFRIFLLAHFVPCLCEWILLPPVVPKQNEIAPGNVTSQICPDLHNLTAMAYGTPRSATDDNDNDWGVSLEDVRELIKQNQQLPKSSEGKARLVKTMEEHLMAEAERRIRGLFSPSREARTSHIHSPSMESALMTISMLLFGVFLSKLILKLLQSHYNRYNGGVMTMMSGIRAPMTIAHGRRGRAVRTRLQHIQLMHLIDKYNPRFN